MTVISPSSQSTGPVATPEQEDIKRIRTGFHVVSANAGTGKTHTLAELICEIYLEEEKRLYPYEKSHVSGEKQLNLLKQIMAITFTRDAARELDERVLKLLESHGVPEPIDRFGKRVRLCRTLDSLIQQWMRRPILIEAALKIDPDLNGSTISILRNLNPETRAHFISGEGRPEVSLFRQWNWLAGDEIVTMLFDVLHRGNEDPIPGLSLEQWRQDFPEFLANLPPPSESKTSEHRWGSGFWEEKVAIYKSYQTEMWALHRQMTHGKLSDLPREEFEKSQLRLEVWRSHNAAMKEFFSVFEIARSRGYHPVRSIDRLAALPVLQELSNSDHWTDFHHFHQMAHAYYAAKMRFGAMDHADFLTACVDTFEANRHLLERDREYPRLGFRTKHVLYDEVQDNSLSNNRLFQVLCAPKVPYLGLAVGDAKQAIYGFRGACTHGFGAMIESVRRRNPQNIHHLTCSFRSHAKIVELGNECVMTLPPYKASVHPSHTIFTEPGEIVMAPPLKDALSESEWVLQKVWPILYNTQDSVMVLHRNNLNDHPIYASVEDLKKEFPGRFNHYTIHRSKGLQAHHVFVLGLTATILPDVRTAYTQSVNLFYVALTRPRKALYLSAPYSLEKVDASGIAQQVIVGPSPFIHGLPTLNELAQKSGWSLSQLAEGVATTRQAAASLASRVGAKEHKLRSQWRSLWPHIPMREAGGDEPTDEIGSSPVSSGVKAIQRKSIYEAGELIASEAPRLDSGLLVRLEKKLYQASLKNGQVPRLTKDELVTALKQGWVVRPPQGGAFSISVAFTCRKTSL